MTTLIGIPFDFVGMSYYSTDKDIDIGEEVVVTNQHGTFVGKVVKMRTAGEEELQRENFTALFPPIDRVATFSDKSFYSKVEEKAKIISNETQKQADSLNLGMKVLKTYICLNEDKALITFTSDARVDFRELVRILNGTFHMKIELRQIGPRDQARVVGGIGPCGLPLCCTTFLNSFDGISIAMAKNQLLAINIPKLSGQCGKLMCCLKFEDKAYAELRPLYPKIGEKFTYMNKQYEVTGLNLLTDTITTYNGNNYESFSKEEYERVLKGLAKQDAATIELNKDVNSGVDLSGHGISDTNNRIAQIKINEERRKEQADKNNNNKNNNNKRFNKNNRNNNNNNRYNNNNNRNNQNNNRNNNNNKNFHYNQNRHNNNNAYKKPESSNSGFIPVSQISDKSVLNVKPVKDDDQK